MGEVGSQQRHIENDRRTLPSRVEAARQAQSALSTGATVCVCGDSGSGLTTFAQQLTKHLSPYAHEVLHVSASASLANTRFALLATLSARLPELAHITDDPVAALTLFGERARRKTPCIVLDRAQYVDPESASVIAQLAELGTVRVVLTTQHPHNLPEALQHLVGQQSAVQLRLNPIDVTDAKVLLDGEFIYPVNASAATLMNDAAAGNPRSLMRLATDAHRAGTLIHSNGYLVLTQQWQTGHPLGVSADNVNVNNDSAATLLSCAESSFVSGNRDQALTQLAPLLAVNDPEARLLAARIEFAGQGDPIRAIQLLESKPNDPIEFAAQSMLWFARAGRIVDCEQLRVWADEDSLLPKTRLALVASLIVHQCYQGDPAGGLARAFQTLSDPIWHLAPAPERSELVHALHLAMLCEGSHELMHEAQFVEFDWSALKLDHTLFIVARAYTALEYGRAAEALELAEQAMSLTAVSDPHNIDGFSAACGAGAATMLENHAQAALLLQRFREAPSFSGHLLRPEAERVVLGAILNTEGTEAARTEFERLRDHAVAHNNRFVAMRLTHEAWRFGLIDSWTEMARFALGVTGRLAQSLRSVVDPAHVEAESSAQLGHGRTLFAAEFLAQAARDARDADDRVLSLKFLGQSAELANELPWVNTPRLARVALDPELLTARETEVCVRAASGLTNAEIADELFLSSRTVEGHLQRAYAKLGVSDRRQIMPHFLS